MIAAGDGPEVLRLLQSGDSTIALANDRPPSIAPDSEDSDGVLSIRDVLAGPEVRLPDDELGS
jgi:hypothetical protein